MQITSYPKSPLPARATARDGLVAVPTSGVDLLSIDRAPATEITEAQRRQGWGQIGASVGVKVFNAGLAGGASIGLAALASRYFGPIGTVIGAVAGLAGGLAIGAFGQGSNLESPVRPLKNGAAFGGASLGAALSPQLQRLFPTAVKNYQLNEAALPYRVSQAEVDSFKKQLQPGDILLTLSDDDPMFHSIVSAQKKSLDFTHAALYAGNDLVLEANTDTGKVGYREANSVLGDKSHIVAVRPNYQEGQAQKVVEQAASYLGRPYDWYLSLDDRRMGCVELPYHALRNAAPKHTVPISNLWGIAKYIFPSDFLYTEDSQVVASAGLARPASSMRMARYTWAAAGLGEESV